MTEFSRLYRVDALSDAPRDVEIEAAPGEAAALATRFDLPAIGSLSAAASLVRRDKTVIAEGALRAQVTQSCVATGEPVAARVEAPFRIEFRPLPEAGRPDEEVELSEAELDVVFYEGSSIDLGEAVAETLHLSLDPYPRSPAAESALREAGVKSEEAARQEASPFAALAALKAKLGE